MQRFGWVTGIPQVQCNLMIFFLLNIHTMCKLNRRTRRWSSGSCISIPDPIGSRRYLLQFVKRWYLSVTGYVNHQGLIRVCSILGKCELDCSRAETWFGKPLYMHVLKGERYTYRASQRTSSWRRLKALDTAGLCYRARRRKMTPALQ
jgi:hypothetical protein